MPERYHQPALSKFCGYADSKVTNPTHEERVKVPMESDMVGYGYETGVINTTGRDYWFIYPSGEPVLVKSKRTAIASRFTEDDTIADTRYTLRLFKVTSLPYDRIKSYRTLVKTGSATSIERANNDYPEAAGFVELMSRNNIDFNSRIIRRDEATAEEYITYEEFVDIDDFKVHSPTFIKEFNVLIVPTTVSYNDLPLHPFNQPIKNHGKMATDGGRRIQVFDPDRTIDTNRVYLSEFGLACSFPVNRTSYKGKSGVLIEYDNIVSSEGDDGNPFEQFIPLEEVIVPRGKTEPCSASQNGLWLYSSFREAMAASDQPALQLAKAEKELVKLKNDMLLKEQVIKERDMVLKSEYSASEHSHKMMKNESDSYKLQWQALTVLAVGVFGLVKAFR